MPPAFRLVVSYRADGTTSPNATFRETVRDRIDEFLHASQESHKQTPTRAAPRFTIASAALLLRPHGVDHAAFVSLHLLEAWHRRAEAELVGVGGVNAAHERLRNALQSFAAEAPPHERSEAFIAVDRATREQNLRCHSQFTAYGEQRGLNEGPEARGREKKISFRKR